MKTPTSALDSNIKLNRLAKIGYFAAATFDPYGLISLLFALLLWMRGAGNKQVGGFVANMLIHILATAIFDAYFTTLKAEIVYSVIFATMIPFILYHLTKLPTGGVANSGLVKFKI